MKQWMCERKTTAGNWQLFNIKSNGTLDVYKQKIMEKMVCKGL
jgi:hypothetical protein